MKSQEQIQHAHDILAAIILKEVPVQVPPEQMARLLGAADVLCWMLDHEHNRSFRDNLARIEALFETMNIQEVRTITN